MSYFHILVHEEKTGTHVTLLFKDLSHEELHSPFLVRFLAAAQPDAASPISTNSLRARVIRTEVLHDDALTVYLRQWGEKAEELMRLSGHGYPVNSQMGDSAIAGAGTDITEEFLATNSRKPGP